jgi:hypothetical protein
LEGLARNLRQWERKDGGKEKSLLKLVAPVRRCDNHPPRSGKGREMVWEEKTRNSCHLSVEKGKRSCHLVFWSLGILTGIRVWEKELIA